MADKDQADMHAGALSLTDARILAFPVRSLKGVFAWVTCPAVLGRLNRDLKLADSPNGLALPAAPGKDKALCQQSGPLLEVDVEEKELVLEEFEFERAADAGKVPGWIASHEVDDYYTSKRLQSHLVVLDDEYFIHFVQHATEVVARIALDYERKTVKGTALFYEEFLPAETLFYSVVLASASRRAGHGKTAQQMLDYLHQKLPRVLQIGGDETIGKGTAVVRLSAGKDGAT